MNKQKGFVNGRMVKLVTFTIITICLIGVIMLAIFSVWDYTDQDTLWRAMATLAIVGIGFFSFYVLNGYFGE